MPDKNVSTACKQQQQQSEFHTLPPGLTLCNSRQLLHTCRQFLEVVKQKWHGNMEHIYCVNMDDIFCMKFGS
jgi:hypothetical protein